MKTTADQKDGGKRQYNKNGLFSADPAEWKREYKRKQRRKNGAQLRSDIAAKARAKREQEVQARQEKAQPKLFHDAHVKRFKQVMRSRAAYLKRYSKNPEAERARSSSRKARIPDSYVVQMLTSSGVERHLITPELIDLKRTVMEWRRISKNIRSTLKTVTKEEHETISKHT